MSDQPAEPVEIEWQFDALDLRPVERWLAALPSRTAPDELPTLTALAKPPRRLVDRYVDTEDWRVAQAGFVLRVRRRGRVEEATMKDTRPAGAGGLRQRLEVTESLPPGGLGALGAGGPVGRRLHAIAGTRPFLQVLEIRTRRQPFSLRAGGTEVAEVALDDTTIVVGGGQRPAQLRRVEVEVVPEWVDALTPLVEELRSATGMSPASLSKFEAGLLAAGVAPPGPPDLGPLQVGPGAAAGTLAFVVLRRHLGVLLAKEPGTRLGDDIEELHDMRVATRRLRAAMDLFVDVLPARSRQLREELRWLADALGAVRDLDVQLERMAEMSEWARGLAGGLAGAMPADPLGGLRTLLEAERATARHDLLDALDSPRWARLSAALVALVRQGPNRRVAAVRQAAALMIPPLVLVRHRAVLKAARRARRSGLAADYHRLRIRGKRLRYSLEFTAVLYGPPAQRFIRKLTRLQDVLGLMQDAEVASTRLASLATAASGGAGGGAAGLEPATVFVMGGVAEHYRRESDELLGAVPRHLAVLTGPSWNALATQVERARSRAAAAASASATPTLADGRPGRGHWEAPAATPAATPAADPRTTPAATPAATPATTPTADPRTTPTATRAAGPAADPGTAPAAAHSPARGRPAVGGAPRHAADPASGSGEVARRARAQGEPDRDDDVGGAPDDGTAATGASPATATDPLVDGGPAPATLDGDFGSADVPAEQAPSPNGPAPAGP